MSVIAIPNPIGTGRIIQEVPFGSASAAAAPTSVNAAVADTGVAQVFAPTHQPDGRQLIVTPTGTTADITAVQCVVTGIAIVNGIATQTTETLPAFTAGAATAVTSVNTWDTISSITQPPLGAAPPTAVPVNLEYGQAALAGTPKASSATVINAAVADTGATQVFTPTGQPDVPRQLIATPGGTTANVTAISVTVTGLDAAGNPVTEVLPAFTAGAATAVKSVNAFSQISSISQPACGTSVTIAYGVTDALGLGFGLNTNTVIAAFLNGVKEATPPTVVTSATPGQCLVTLNSALNGDPVRVDFYYPS